jgi:hypothetical protein
MYRALLLALTILTLAGTATAAKPRPTLSIPNEKPLVVRGAHFKAEERVVVKLVVADRQPQTRRATASTLGTFTVGFGAVPLSRCLAYSVSAVGSAGSRAVFRRQLPACMPA